MIYFLPIEDIEQRYSVMMNQAIRPYVDKELYPKMPYPSVIEKGEFLDINKTCIFKSKQLQMVSELFYRNKIKHGDIFLIGDIFFPGIEMIRYMAELQKIKVYIFGWSYAGRADYNDFVRKLGYWADASESGYYSVCDMVFVGSIWHRTAILNYYDLDNVVVTGLVWDRDYVTSVYNKSPKKENYVIFPHRMSAEKGITDLIAYAKRTTKHIVVTSSGNKVDVESIIHEKLPSNIEYVYNLKKKEYYEIMAKAKYYLSTAKQETFGYTLQEAIHFGCQIAVPDRVCYREMVPKKNLYKMIYNIDKTYKKVPVEWTEKHNNNIVDMMSAIDTYILLEQQRVG